MTTYNQNTGYSPRHICCVCGHHWEQHSGPNNPLAAPAACPSGEFPKWPKLKDEAKAGALFDKRLAAFWKRSKSTFKGW